MSPRFQPISPWLDEPGVGPEIVQLAAFAPSKTNNAKDIELRIHLHTRSIDWETTTAGLHHACCACCICAACRGQNPVMDWGGSTILTTASRGRCIDIRVFNSTTQTQITNNGKVFQLLCMRNVVFRIQGILQSTAGAIGSKPRRMRNRYQCK